MHVGAGFKPAPTQPASPESITTAGCGESLCRTLRACGCGFRLRSRSLCSDGAKRRSECSPPRNDGVEIRSRDRYPGAGARREQTGGPHRHPGVSFAHLPSLQCCSNSTTSDAIGRKQPAESIAITVVPLSVMGARTNWISR